MAFKDWSITPLNNGTKPSINLAEGMPPADVNNSVRQIMTDLAIGSMVRIDSIAELVAREVSAATVGSVVWLSVEGRQGIFKCYAGAASSDPLQGQYIVSSTSGYYWLRQRDGTPVRPEWWGAVADGVTDCLAAIQAAVASAKVVEFRGGDYLISDTLVIASEDRTLKGTSRFNKNATSGTRIVMAHASKTVCRVGYTSQPSGAPEQDAVGAGFLKDVALQDLTFFRSVAPIPIATIANPLTGAIGLDVRYVLKCRFDRLLIQDSSVGCYAGGTIYTKFDDVECRIDRNTSAGNQDTCRGWYLDGTVSFGYAGGNASIYLDRCVGVAGRKSVGAADAVIPIGLLAKGSFVDSFLDHFEVAGTSKGMVFDGTGAGTFGTVDLYINHPIIDQYDTRGIEVNNIGEAAIEIIAPYTAWNGSGSEGLLLASGSGVTVLGGQLIGGSGLACSSLSNSQVVGLKIRESTSPVVLTNCDSLDISVQANNRTTYAAQAVNMTNCARCRIAPLVISASAAPTNFSYGINLASGNANCLLDVSAIGNSATSDRIRTGGGGGSGVTTQGDVSGHVIINPGQGAML